MEKDRINSDINGTFWLHLLIMVLAWTGPFLIYWPLMITAYIIIQLQFYFFNRCLMNEGHGLADSDKHDFTFYAYLLELVGFRPSRPKLKFLARRVFNYMLLAFTLLWQVFFEFQPLLF